MKLQGYIHLPNLDYYTPQVSTENSWITYGANRVDLLGINEVRYYGASGLLYVDSAPKVVYEAALDK
jgi:hypothetical protein